MGGTPIQWVILITLMSSAFTALGIWLKYGPSRMLAANAKHIIDNDAAKTLRTEWESLNKQNRTDIHRLNNELQKIIKEQIDCAKELSEAHAINRANRDDMRTMMFLIRLLISEVKRLDPDPDNNIIIHQCEDIMAELDRRTHSSVVQPNKNGKSGALVAAETAVGDAKQTVVSAIETCEEVERTEGEAKT